MRKMRKLFLISLLVCLCITVVSVNSVLAKVKFGGWDKWDEELPPWNNEGWVYSEESLKIISIPLVGETRFWFWTEEKKQWGSIKIKGSPSLTENEKVFLLVTCLGFKDEDNDRGASITIFSPVPTNKEIIKIEDALATAEIAVAAFPSKEKLIIRSYGKEDGSLQFLEKWTIACENGPIIPEKYKAIFVDRFKRLTEENIEILPYLVVFKTEGKKGFFIGVSFPLLKEFLIEEKLPWIKEETIVVF